MEHRMHPRPKRHAATIVLVASLLLVAPCAVLAQSAPPSHATAPDTPTTLPAWDDLTPAQRELLIAPIRERWNTNPDSRARIYGHAQDWRRMPPGERKRARHGMRRWEHMPPGKRDEMRALFHKMRGMTPEQRSALQKQWHEMSDAQRQAWVKANPPARD